MQYRTLGRTGLKVSEIGYGTWGAGGGTQWKDSDDVESRLAMRRAFDLGVNLYDTALVYGNGHSEKLVGELAKAVGRDNVLIATKIPAKNMEWPARCGVSTKETFPPEHIRECTIRSLRNLKTDHIDLQQLHVWQDHWLEEDDWQEELLRLKQEGKIRFVGASINDHDPLSAMLLAQRKIADVMQVIYNIFDNSPEMALFPLCQEFNIGILARCPFDEGALTGKITATTTFPPGDFREAYFAGDRRVEVEQRVKKLSTLLNGEAKALPELALRFCLSNPLVSTVIPGMRRVSHVESNTSVSDGRKLTDKMLRALEAHAWVRNFYP